MSPRPRSRSRSRQRQDRESGNDTPETEREVEAPAVADSTENDTNTNVTERTTRKMAGLSADQVTALLGKTRTKGQYVGLLKEFMEGGELGVDVQEQWPELREKQPSTIKQGFDNAKENKEAPDGSEHIQVISQKEGEGDNAIVHIYLVNKTAYGTETGNVEAEAA